MRDTAALRGALEETVEGFLKGTLPAPPQAHRFMAPGAEAALMLSALRAVFVRGEELPLRTALADVPLDDLDPAAWHLIGVRSGGTALRQHLDTRVGWGAWTLAASPERLEREAGRHFPRLGEAVAREVTRPFMALVAGEAGEFFRQQARALVERAFLMPGDFPTRARLAARLNEEGAGVGQVSPAILPEAIRVLGAALSALTPSHVNHAALEAALKRPVTVDTRQGLTRA